MREFGGDLACGISAAVGMFAQTAILISDLGEVDLILCGVRCRTVVLHDTPKANRPVTGRSKFRPFKRTLPTCKPCARYRYPVTSPQKKKTRARTQGFFQFQMVARGGGS